MGRFIAAMSWRCPRREHILNLRNHVAFSHVDDCSLREVIADVEALHKSASTATFLSSQVAMSLMCAWHRS